MRFLLLFTILAIGFGLFLQAGIDLPYLGWLGRLPGDLLIRKNGILIHFPMTSSLLISVVCSLLFGRKK